MDINHTPVFVFLHSILLKQTEHIRYSILFIGYVHKANWFLPLNTEKKSFSILLSSEQDQILLWFNSANS